LRLKEELRNSEKDQAENVMIVDLVRNDLARTAIRCTVKVEELFGIYGFRQVWQMISTVSSRFDQSQDSLAAIKAAFPPGSMTGAPKIISMELIEKFESSLRGTFSGTLGYFSPDGNFDFNVLIRSIFYNEKESLISFQTGGAIVYDSNPEQEYEECMLKAKAMLLALGID
jgi:para-aminobenzoate synthetase component 1